MTLRLTARNSATGSENRIHSDEVARQYGFTGGLVPGVSVFGYLMRAFAAWPRALEVKLLKPVFDGDEVLIFREGDRATAIRHDEVCAQLTIGGVGHDFSLLPEAPLPERDRRPWATSETVTPGKVLGTVRKHLDDTEAETLLNLANQALLDNFLLHPWLHVSSEIAYSAAARAGEEIAVHSRIHDRFEKKSREFLVLDVALSQRGQMLQSIRHTAIYHIRTAPGPSTSPQL